MNNLPFEKLSILAVPSPTVLVLVVVVGVVVVMVVLEELVLIDDKIVNDLVANCVDPDQTMFFLLNLFFKML